MIKGEKMGRTIKCTKCGKVFDSEQTVLKPIGDGGYAECCPKCGSTSGYSMDDYSYNEEESRGWRF